MHISKKCSTFAKILVSFDNFLHLIVIKLYKSTWQEPGIFII